MSIFFAALSALSYGGADYAGGKATRAHNVLAVLADRLDRRRSSLSLSRRSRRRATFESRGRRGDRPCSPAHSTWPPISSFSSLYPAPTVLFARAFDGQRLGPRRIAGLVLSLAGVALMAI